MLRDANMTAPDSDQTSPNSKAPSRPTLICFSHLRWNFVYQRPQHLMSRFARDFDVFFWEEPLDTEAAPYLIAHQDISGVTILTPHLPITIQGEARTRILRALLNEALVGRPGDLVRWFYTPMMLPISQHLNAALTVYDCMDELSAFKFSPPDLPQLEQDLFQAADIVFTGGYSLYEAKSAQHPNVHPFPSAVDIPHFAQAREMHPMADAPPTIGFYGVVDERFDSDLLAHVADLRPNIRFEIVGPIVKIDPASLPQRHNILYSGAARYEELPDYLGRWHAAMMPFARNDSTRFISPTKTPEYLAAGRPVVSTAVRDVERSYGQLAGVLFADEAEGFAAACDAALLLAQDRPNWLPQVDAILAEVSWDRTYSAMLGFVKAGLVSAASFAKLRAVAKPHYDFLIVGAGFAGAVMAERLAADAGKRVLIIDKRPHIAGNAYDERNAAGHLIHLYGPHIFHTNSDEVFDYVSRFTEWCPYEHRVLAQVRGKLVPIPINRTTINALYGLSLANEEEVSDFLEHRREPVDVIRTSEDVVISAVGRELYALFFEGYTRKQWGLDPSELDRSVTARIPTRTNTDDRYFTDVHQAMPAKGYTAMFGRMLAHPNIDVRLGVSHADVADLVSYDRLVWTGPIDEYFDCCFGELPYRSLRFEHRTLPQSEFQPTGTVNYPSETVAYTRITEFGHLTGEVGAQTSIVYEYPEAKGDPYYPIPRPENQALFRRYDGLAQETDTIFVGRLATYRYFNMDQVIGQALAVYRRLRPSLVQSDTQAVQLAEAKAAV